MKRCAVIGMGLLGSQHAERLYHHETTQIVAVCDMKLEKAKSWAEGKNVACYDNFNEMFSKEQLDLVVVATQDPYHKEPLLAACEAKVPYVISEKPLTTRLDDALEVAVAAKKSGTVIKVLFPNRFYPLDQAIRLLLCNGYIGEPQYGEMRMDDSIDVPLSLWGKDSKNFSRISSPAFFLLSHSVDLLSFYFAPRKVVKVYAVGKQGTIGSEVDYMDSFLTYDNGMVIRLKTEWTKRMDTLVENYVQFTAEKGGVSFNKTPGFQCEQGLRIVIDGGKELAEQAANLLDAHGIHAKIQVYGETPTYALVLKASEDNDFDWNHGVCLYADSFDGAEPELSPVTTLEGGIEQVRVVEALLNSAKTGKEVVL